MRLIRAIVRWLRAFAALQVMRLTYRLHGRARPR